MTHTPRPRSFGAQERILFRLYVNCPIAIEHPRQLYNEYDLTYEDLAMIAGCTTRTIERWMAEQEPSTERGLSAALGRILFSVARLPSHSTETLETDLSTVAERSTNLVPSAKPRGLNPDNCRQTLQKTCCFEYTRSIVTSSRVLHSSAVMVNSIISNFDITKEALPDLLLRISQGKVQIPDLQRSFCWSDELVIELLASISLGWPVGSIMLLEQGNGSWSFRPRTVEGVCVDCTVQPTHLILDGQQRSTALYMTLFSGNPVRTRGKRTPKQIERWYYIDIAKALNPEIERTTAILSLHKNRMKAGTEGTIDCTTCDLEYANGLFPIAQVFHYTQWRQGYSRFWQYDPGKLELIDRFEQEVIKRFEHYQVPVIQLRSEVPKAAVCKVFEKTNTQGTELNFFDLATACFASEDFSLRHDWAIKEQRLKQHTLLQSVRETDFLACVTLAATYFRRQAAMLVATPLKKLPGIACGRAEVLDLSVDEYRRYNEKVMVGYETAARFLHGQSLFNTDDLPYQIQLVALAAILTVVGPPHEQLRSKLEQWFWCGACCGLYTSWHEVRAARDMLEVPAWLLGDGALPATARDAHFGANRLISSQQRRGAVYKSVSALLRQHRAVDFATGEALFDVQFFNDPIESHHIFPVAYCKRQGIPPVQYNCLINRTPLSQLSNQKIGGHAPSQYLQALVDQGIDRSRLDMILRSHLIAPQTLWNDDFEGFMSARTQALVELVTQAMGKAPTATQIDGPARSDSSHGKVLHNRGAPKPQRESA